MTSDLHAYLCTYMISRSVLLRMRNVPDKQYDDKLCSEGAINFFNVIYVIKYGVWFFNPEWPNRSSEYRARMLI